MARTSLLLSLLLASSAVACSSSTETSDLGSPGGDAATSSDAAGSDRDAGLADAPQGLDALAPDASGADAWLADAQSMDAERMDSTPGPDSGVMLTAEIAPGQHIQLPSARVSVMTDSFADIRGRLGPGVRTATPNTRSYEWTINGAHLTVWFANSRLTTDPPPNDIHDTDKVLWVSVDGTFTGRTTKNIGLGSTRAMVEMTGMAGYGPAPHNVPVMGTVVAQYYTTGFLVTYSQPGPAGTITTFTVCRAYPHAPDAQLLPARARISFGGGAEILGSILMLPPAGQNGSSENTVRQVLGTADGEGMVRLGGQNLRVLSYSFIGLEVFFIQGQTTVLFVSVHPPYYGSFAGGAGLGSTRADVERALNLGTGTPSAGTPGLICYRGAMGRDVGVTYTAAPATATTITIPLLVCP